MKIKTGTFRCARRALLGAASLALLTACGGDSSGPMPDEQGWLNLFNGSDLTWWSTLGDANWRVEDGAITADEGTAASFLVSESDFTDFVLELEFWVDSEANSGVFFRCSSRESIADTNCYEANIYDTRPDQTYRTGSIVNVAEPTEFVYTGGQWNRYEIRAEGSHLQVTLNGKQLVDVEDSSYASGPIALQHGSGTVRFRNVRVREL